MKGPSGLYQKVLRACESGEVRAYKDGKRWVVNNSDVLSFQATLRAARSSITSTVGAKKAAVSDVDRLCESIDSLSESFGVAVGEVAGKVDLVVDMLAQLRNQILHFKYGSAEQKEAQNADIEPQ